MIKYLDEKERGINSVRDKIQKNFTNELEIITPKEEKEDSEI